MLIALANLSYSQYSIKSYSNESYNQCEPIEYQLELEKVAAADFADNKLLIEFSHDVSYQENSLGLVLEQSSESTLLFNLDELSTCDFLSGNLVVFPSCQETIINLEVKFKIINDQECVAESVNFTIVKVPFVDVDLGEYSIDLEQNQLSKEFTIKNIGRSPINTIEIYPEIQGAFMSLVSVSAGSIVDGKVVLDSDDLTTLGHPSGSLPIQESVTTRLVYDINQCALNEVRYNISFPCAEIECDTKVVFVDENINYDSAIELTSEVNTLYYGLCAFESNRFSIKNTYSEENSDLGNLYNLKHLINSKTLTGSTINGCFDSEAYVRLNPVAIIAEGNNLILDFSSFTTDPDGPGGLEDLDNDGIYDDLKSGESIDIDIRLKVKESCAQNYHTQDYGILSSTNVRNICGATVNIPDTENNLRFALNLSGFPASIEFKRDASDFRYIEEGDEFEFRYQISYSENIDRICDSEMLVFEIDVPSTTILNESKSIYHFNGTDTVLLEPNSIQGTIMNFEFAQLDSAVSTIVIPFTAVCLLEENTNYDASIDLCEQCLEYEMPRFSTLLSKPCPTQDCGVPYKFPDRISASFYTSCENIPEVKNGLVVHEPEYYRLPPGFIDEDKTIRRNPFETPSDINNRTYFDHDTMLIRIPFEFDCPGSEEDFRLYLNLGSMANLDVEQLSSTLNSVSSSMPKDTMQCNVDNHTSIEGRVLSFDVTESAYPTACIMQGSEHWLDLKLLIKYTCEIRRNCGLASRNIMTLSMDEVFSNTCRRTRIISRDSIYINELYKESFGGHQFFFPSQLSLYDEFSLGLSLYNTLTISESEPIDVRPLPIIREITYTFPMGYEPVDDLNVLIGRNSISQFGFLTQEETIAISLTPTISQNNDGSVSYTYSDPVTENYTNVVTKSIFSNLKIKTTCEPISDFNVIHVDASIEYVDFADGTLETRVHRYEEEIPVSYARKAYPPSDGFQIKTSELNLDWEILNKSTPSLGIFSNNNIKKDKDENDIIIKYSSNSSQIDSLIIKPQDFGFSDENDTEVEYQKLDNNTFKIFPPYSFFENENLDTIFIPPPVLNFSFKTSNHQCGFDTLIYQIGLAKEFMDEICSPTIFTDTLITYSPPGFPLLEIVSAPTEIDYNQENEIIFSVSNMGQGEFSLSSFSFEQLPEADLTFLLVNSQGVQVDISDAVSREGDAVNISFADRPTLFGITEDQVSQYTFILEMNNICPLEQFFTTTANTTVQSHCGDFITSNYTRLDQIPYIDVAEIDYLIDHTTYVDVDFNERVHLVVSLSTIDGSASPLSDASLQMYIPKDLSFVPGSIMKNGQVANDPNVEINDENRILILEDQNVMNGDVFEIALDLECTDRCIIQEIRSYLLINESTDCNGNSSIRVINKNKPRIQDLYYYPELDFESLEITEFGIVGDKISLLSNIRLRATGAEDRSNTTIATIYLDRNQNQIIDNDEDILLEIPKSEWKTEDSITTIASMIELNAIDMCVLEVIVESPTNCFNSPILIPLSSEQSITIERDIYLCNQDTVKVELTDYPTCTDRFRNFHERNVRDNILYYPALNNSQIDVIYRDITCGTCLIVEKYSFNSGSQQISIQLEDIGCTTSAIVTWEDGSPIPSSYKIEWNGDPTLSSSEITSFLAGEKIKVSISDAYGCNYADSITAPVMAEIEYTADVELPCDPDSLPLISIAVTGAEPLSITWRDGSSSFERSDLLDGVYHYTIRDGNNCEISDSVIVEKSVPINFTLLDLQSDELGSTIELNSQNIDNENWIWTWESNVELSCNDCPTPTLVLNEFSNVSLIISNEDCSLEQHASYEPIYSDDYYSPNIFNPKSTDNNRFLIFPNTSYDYYDMMILDRWGNIVYDKKIDNWLEGNVGWDGTFRGQNVSSGVYVYKIKLTRESDATEISYSGDFVLIR